MRLIKQGLVTSLHKDHVTFKRCYNFLSARAVIIKFGHTFLSETHTILQSCGLVGSSLLLQWLCQPNVGGFTNLPALWSRGLPRSYDKLKPLHLHYHNVCGLQT